MNENVNEVSKLNHKKGSAGCYLPAFLSFLVLVFLDQYIKYLVDKNMELYSSIPVVKDVFEIRYIRNPGAAWGILADKQILFYIGTIIVIIFGVFVFIRCTQRNMFGTIRCLIVLILSGAVGNFIDRLRFQYVIDFLYFKLIDFPVFNLADCYVTIGFAILIFLVLFKYKDEDFEKLK